MLILCDVNPVHRIRRPVVTWALIVACVLATLGFWQHMTSFWAWDTAGAWFPALMLHLLVHIDGWHLVGNLLVIWVFGDNVEDALGHARFALFLIVTGLAASFGEVLLSPTPVVILGASGMASAIMGGYLLLHPLARIVVAFNPVPVWPMAFPATLVVVVFLLTNVVGLLFREAAQIAWSAHLIGFVLGVVLTFLLRTRGIPILQGPQSPEAILAGTGAVQRRVFVSLDWLGGYHVHEGRHGERKAIEELCRRSFFDRFALFVILVLFGELLLG